MTDPRLTAAETAEVCTRFAAEYPAWTWPEVLRTLRRLLPDEIADAAAEELFELSPWEPDDGAELLADVLGPWTRSPAPSTPVDLSPPASGPTAPAVPELDSLAALARWLDLTPPELEWFADPGSWLRRARPPLRHHRIWRREKRDGFRVIEAPKPRLREIQRRILRAVLDPLPAHPAARGFVRGSSPAAFAWPHTERDTVLRVDLRHCFEHVTEARVRAVFARIGYPPAVARALAQLCTTTTPVADLHGLDPLHASLLRRRHLPQGAPSSPAVANLVLRRLDARLDGYARHHDLRYTRYGDDLAMSGDGMDSGRALWVILRVVSSEGFRVHADKTRVMHRHQRQRLAGLVVNDRPQVPSTEYDALRALLHNAARTGAAAQNRAGHPNFRAHVHGRIAWVGATSPTRRQRLLRMADAVDWDS